MSSEKLPLDPFTPIFNDVLDSLAKEDLSAETRVLFVVWRKTYGFGKKKDKISVSQFIKATGLSERTINRALGSLKAKKLISRKYMMTSFLKPNPAKNDTPPEMTGVKNVRQGVSKLAGTKETYTKERDTTYAVGTPPPQVTGRKEKAPFSYIFHEQEIGLDQTESKPISPKYDFKAVRRLIVLLAQKQGIRTFGNWGRQTKAIHDLMDKGVTAKEIEDAMGNMLLDPYWRGRRFDFVSVSGNIHNYINGTGPEPIDEVEKMIKDYEAPEKLKEREKILNIVRKREGMPLYE